MKFALALLIGVISTTQAVRVEKKDLEEGAIKSVEKMF